MVSVQQRAAARWPARRKLKKNLSKKDKKKRLNNDEYIFLIEMVWFQFSNEQLPADLQGSTFSCVHGYSSSALEILLLDNKIKGPCWLEVQGAVKGQGGNLTWCKIEVILNKFLIT